MLTEDNSVGDRRIKIQTDLEQGMREGLQAFTVQPFTEINSKLGVQYEASFFNPSLASGASADIVIEVGNEPMLVKDIEVRFNVELISSAVYRSPTWSGGSEIGVYNMSDRSPVPDDVTITAGVTVTDTGTQISPTVYSIGSEGQGNRQLSNVSQTSGVERILAENTTYLLRITNESSISSVISGISTWYQGPVSTEV